MTITGARRPILIVDDDEDDRMIARQALGRALGPESIICLEGGEELLDYLGAQGSWAAPREALRPALILLDLNMPRLDGREVLALLKADAGLRSIPVVILTTSSAPEDVTSTYRLGCAGFISKPSSFSTLVGLMETVRHYWLETCRMPPFPEVP